jgi:hypothetical protein
VPALDQDGSQRENGEIAEITDHVDLSAWPQGTRSIVRRERPHPGAQLSFTDENGYRFQAILTDQTDSEIGVLECRHRQHAHVEDRIRDDKDTGLSKFPFKKFAHNAVWLEIVSLAHDRGDQPGKGGIARARSLCPLEHPEEELAAVFSGFEQPFDGLRVLIRQLLVGLEPTLAR